MNELELNHQLGLNESVRRTRLSMNEGGSAPTESRPLNRLHPIAEGSGPVPIVPAADSSDTHPQETARMSRVDGCPVCVENYALPRITRDDGSGGFVAYYSCESCGHDWITSWGS